MVWTTYKLRFILLNTSEQLHRKQPQKTYCRREYHSSKIYQHQINIPDLLMCRKYNLKHGLHTELPNSAYTLLYAGHVSMSENMNVVGG